MEESLNEALLTAQHFCIILSEEIKRSQKALLEKKSLNAGTSQGSATADRPKLTLTPAVTGQYAAVS